MSLAEAANNLNAETNSGDIIFSGCSTDTRTLAAGELFIALKGESFDGHDYLEQAMEKGACAVMIEKGFEHSEVPSIRVENTRIAMGNLAETWRNRFSLPLVAVTGSNGKTTVKEMLSSILSVEANVLSTSGNLNNDIGVPLTLFRLNDEHEYAVIEMGANHPGEIAQLAALAHPHIALITLCAPSHLEGFGSIAGVARAKAEIYSGLIEEGVAIVNADDDYADFWLEKVSGYKRLTFAVENDADVRARDIQLNKQNACTSFILSTACAQTQVDLQVLGLHNVHNALAAAACCIALNIPLSQIREGLQRMQAVKGRMQSLPGKNDCVIIDDTYNANPGSMQAAIKTASASTNTCWLVMGDMGELGDEAVSAHQQVGENARIAGVERLYALGSLSEHASTAFGQGAQHFEDMNSLIETLDRELEPGLIILVKGSRFMGMENVVKALAVEN